MIAQGDYTISIGGGQTDTGAPAVAESFVSKAKLPCRNRVPHLNPAQG